MFLKYFIDGVPLVSLFLHFGETIYWEANLNSKYSEILYTKPNRNLTIWVGPAYVWFLCINSTFNQKDIHGQIMNTPKLAMLHKIDRISCVKQSGMSIQTPINRCFYIIYQPYKTSILFLIVFHQPHQQCLLYTNVWYVCWT